MTQEDYTPQVGFDYPDWVLPLVMQATKGSSVTPELLLALLRQESGFNPRAVSPAGATGIAQFMPATAKEYGVDPWDPQSAIPGAVRYLQRYYDLYQDWSKTLAAYNAGPGNVPHWQQIPETSNYVRSILGSVGSVPQARAAAPQVSAYAPTPQGGRSHTVRPGETLWGLAQQYLGSGSRWKELQGYSGDPRKMPIGTVINY